MNLQNISDMYAQVKRHGQMQAEQGERNWKTLHIKDCKTSNRWCIWKT
jgi:hypothetical protein